METQIIEVILTGALFMGSIILGIGPQNLHVLRCGMDNNRIKEVVLICAVGDIAIILLGTYSYNLVANLLPQIKIYLNYAGFLVLSYYAFCTLLQIKNDKHYSEGPPSIRAIKGALLLTFCNPCVYLDSFFLIGQQANLYNLEGRWYYAIGASLTSGFWYIGLGFGSSFFKNILNKKNNTKIINICISVILIYTALRSLFL